MRFLMIERNNKSRGVAIPLNEIESIERYDDKVSIWVKSGEEYQVMMNFYVLIELLSLEHHLIIKGIESKTRTIPLPEET